MLGTAVPKATICKDCEIQRTNEYGRRSRQFSTVKFEFLPGKECLTFTSRFCSGVYRYCESRTLPRIASPESKCPWFQY